MCRIPLKVADPWSRHRKHRTLVCFVTSNYNPCIKNAFVIQQRFWWLSLAWVSLSWLLWNVKNLSFYDTLNNQITEFLTIIITTVVARVLWSTCRYVLDCNNIFVVFILLKVTMVLRSLDVSNYIKPRDATRLVDFTWWRQYVKTKGVLCTWFWSLNCCLSKFCLVVIST